MNPTTGVSKPQKESARDRLATQEEIDILVENLGYQKDAPPVTISSRVGASVLFAVETALRASEIARLRWDQVFVAERYAKILGGKTEAAKRDLPLSSEAIRLLQQMPRTSEEVFNIQTSQMDALFRKARGRVLIKGLRYHDLRHTAITRLAKKLDVLALARAIGHKDLKMLLVYYNESASNLAERLR